MGKIQVRSRRLFYPSVSLTRGDANAENSFGNPLSRPVSTSPDTQTAGPGYGKSYALRLTIQYLMVIQRNLERTGR